MTAVDLLGDPQKFAAVKEEFAAKNG